MKAAVAVAGCAIAGAVAGIAGAAASTSSSSPRPTAHSEHGWFRFGRGLRGLGPRALGMRGLIGPAVHVQAVVLNKAGKAFITVTEDRGTIQSVSGDQLTIKEAVDGVTYRTVTVTIPSSATVMRDFRRSTLSGLHAGDRVQVAQSSEGTTVFAIDPTALPKLLSGPSQGQKWGPASPPAPPPPGA
jgi:hypothetical protein